MVHATSTIMVCGISMTMLMPVLVTVIMTRPAFSYHNNDILEEDDAETEPFVTDSGDYMSKRDRKKVFLCGRRMAITSPRKQNVANRWQYGNNTDIHVDDEPVADKILGGLFAKYGEIPWQVNILLASSLKQPVVFTPTCGGAILSEFWVITAAHCVKFIPPILIKVTVGDYYLQGVDVAEQSFFVDSVFFHDNYQNGLLPFDIALIKIKPISYRGIKFNTFVQPVCLANYEEFLNVGTVLLFSGWGETNPTTVERSRILKIAALPIISKEDCQKIYTALDLYGVVCAGNNRGNTDLCAGDTGAPAVYFSHGMFILYGIFILGTDCSVPEYPVGFASIPDYREWIDRTIGINSKNPYEKWMPTRTAKEISYTFT